MATNRHRGRGFIQWTKTLPEDPYYRFWRPILERVKILSQMLLGAMILALLGLKLACHNPALRACLEEWFPNMVAVARENRTLEIVGKGLAYSAGIDLAYMLFTPKVDEAFEPVVVALAAGVILLASEQQITWEASGGALLLSLAIGVVYLVKKKLFQDAD